MVQNTRRNATWSGDQTLLYDYVVLSDRKLYRHSSYKQARYVKLRSAVYMQCTIFMLRGLIILKQRVRQNKRTTDTQILST